MPEELKLSVSGGVANLFRSMRNEWKSDEEFLRRLLQLPDVQEDNDVANPDSERPAWLIEFRQLGLGLTAERLHAAIMEVEASTEMIRDQTPRHWTSRPTNWISVKGQPRQGNILVTVYGTPDRLAVQEFELEEALRSYSRFRIDASVSATSLLAILRASREAKRSAPRNAG